MDIALLTPNLSANSTTLRVLYNEPHGVPITDITTHLSSVDLAQALSSLHALVTVGKFNTDAYDDFIVFGESLSRTLLSGGDGTWQIAETLQSQFPRGTGILELGKLAQDGATLVVKDMNNDGNADILAVGGDAGPARIALAVGAGQWVDRPLTDFITHGASESSNRMLSKAPASTVILTGDADGDGDGDGDVSEMAVYS